MIWYIYYVYLHFITFIYVSVHLIYANLLNIYFKINLGIVIINIIAKLYGSDRVLTSF